MVPSIKLTERPKHKFQKQNVCVFSVLGKPLLFSCCFLNSMLMVLQNALRSNRFLLAPISFCITTMQWTITKAESLCIQTLSEARIRKEAMTCSAVSVSAVSLVMKSMKDWKVTVPCPLGSTRVMMRANSASPWGKVAKKYSLAQHTSSHFHPLTCESLCVWKLKYSCVSLQSLELIPLWVTWVYCYPVMVTVAVASSPEAPERPNPSLPETRVLRPEHDAEEEFGGAGPFPDWEEWHAKQKAAHRCLSWLIFKVWEESRQLMFKLHISG